MCLCICLHVRATEIAVAITYERTPCYSYRDGSNNDMLGGKKENSSPSAVFPFLSSPLLPVFLSWLLHASSHLLLAELGKEINPTSCFVPSFNAGEVAPSRPLPSSLDPSSLSLTTSHHA
mmetsp:Transcript_13448/g.35254  ORF Transcript_13448/g.35254 Transcript_13448/m.35254 type:complete len:120 (-) Transcript_13448:47-406(-)